jgi:sugar O-acyltransferase (sialic acid O-acetyltransferase NeuD family)
MNLIFGSGGFAKEIDWLIQEIYKNCGVDYRPDYFVTKDDDPLVGSLINGVSIAPESEIYSKCCKDEVNCFIAAGEPPIKNKIYIKIKEKIEFCNFPVLIHPDVTYDNRVGKVIFGEGSIVCSKSVLTTEITLGKFVVVNLGCTIGHDSSVGDFVTISPGAHVSGNVRISDRAYVGTGAVIIQNISICNDSFIGAGSVVTKDISISGTYVGMPARKIK